MQLNNKNVSYLLKIKYVTGKSHAKAWLFLIEKKNCIRYNIKSYKHEQKEEI